MLFFSSPQISEHVVYITNQRHETCELLETWLWTQ